MSGSIIALIYHFWIITAEKSTMITSLLLLWVVWLYIAYSSWKTQWIMTYLFIGSIGCMIEWIGIATCRPYGCFQYSDLLWPKFFNTFPYLLMWVRPFIVISISHLIPSSYTWWKYISLWIVLLLILDLALDPVHIAQWIWSYNEPWPHRFGVPLQNFIWWIITWSLSMWVVEKRRSLMKNTIRTYTGIALMTLFRVQFLLLVAA